uniref:PWWP domain-containing protein n=1 Tax=viral metagenome TaxID=1070528 RepID=A0A6C0KBI4_9ZZZZ
MQQTQELEASGAFVWAKMRGHAWWPALTLGPYNGGVRVVFFGATRLIGTVSTPLRPWRPGCAARGRQSAALKHALGDIKAFYADEEAFRCRVCDRHTAVNRVGWTGVDVTDAPCPVTCGAATLVPEVRARRDPRDLDGARAGVPADPSGDVCEARLVAAYRTVARNERHGAEEDGTGHKLNEHLDDKLHVVMEQIKSERAARTSP